MDLASKALPAITIFILSPFSNARNVTTTTTTQQQQQQQNSLSTMDLEGLASTDSKKKTTIEAPGGLSNRTIDNNPATNAASKNEDSLSKIERQKLRKQRRLREKQGLRGGERRAIQTYTKVDYMIINSGIRQYGYKKYMSLTGMCHTSTVRKMISGLPKLPSYSGKVWRATGRLPASVDLREGKIFCDKAFLSTSTKKSVAHEGIFLTSTGGVVFEITHFSGKEITSISVEGEKECEVLFLPETPFEITKVERGKTLYHGIKTNVTYVWMTEVGYDDKQPPLEAKDDTKASTSQPKAPVPEPAAAHGGDEEEIVESDPIPVPVEAVVTPEARVTVTVDTSESASDEVSTTTSHASDDLGSQWINGRRRSARLQSPLGSLYVSGLRRSARLIR